MTISTTVSRVSYNGNGVTTAFATTFRFFEAGDLVVQLVEADETVVMQTITTDYTVTGADDDAGGTVTMIVPPASGERLVIQRVVEAVQETDYASGDPFPAESHERALDRLTMLVQQNEDEISRSFRLGPTSLATAELPAAEAGKFLGWSEDGLSIVNLDSTGTGAGEITTVKIADDNVTFAKLQNIATDRILGRSTASSGDVEELTGAETQALLPIQQTRVDVASAATVNLTTDAPNTDNINITGTTTITAFTVAAGRLIFVRFNAALTLTNNASIVTQSGANIITAAGDTCVLRATAANTVEVLFYVRGIPQALGDGQTWQLLTGSRSLGTTYTNTTGRSISIAVESALATGQALSLTIGGVVAGYQSNAQPATNTLGAVTIVPPGATYVAAGGTLQRWSELR